MSLSANLLATLRWTLGRPAAVPQVIATTPGLEGNLDLPRRSVHVASVPAWHDWPDTFGQAHATFLGWGRDRGEYVGQTWCLAAFGDLVACTEIPDWKCDIQAVDGLAASKSDLSAFATLERFIEVSRPGLLTPATPQKLEELLSHYEIRVLHDPSASDSFVQYLWDGRIFLLNSGGSHHFAAARYLAARLVVPVPLQGHMRMYRIHADAVDSLSRAYGMYVFAGDPVANNAFHDAMRRDGVTYLQRDMPRPYLGQRLILLPIKEARSRAVSEHLASAGIPDLGSHLRGLLRSQGGTPPATSWF